MKEMKKYHLAHHYKNFDLGFGVTCEFFFFFKSLHVFTGVCLIMRSQGLGLRFRYSPSCLIYCTVNLGGGATPSAHYIHNAQHSFYLRVHICSRQQS